MNPLSAPQTNRKDRSNRITVANQAEITLREDHNLDLQYDRTLDLNFSDELGIGSQDYRARSAEAEGSIAFGDDFELGLDLDLEFDLGLMDDDMPFAQGATDGIDGDRHERDESPSANAAKQRGEKAVGVSRVASIAAQARERSEAPSEALSELPSVELGRDAATPLSVRHSDILGQGQETLDDSVLKGGQGTDSFGMDLEGPDFALAGDGTTFDFGGDQYDASLPQDGQHSESIANSQALRCLTLTRYVISASRAFALCVVTSRSRLTGRRATTGRCYQRCERGCNTNSNRDDAKYSCARRRCCAISFSPEEAQGRGGRSYRSPKAGQDSQADRGQRY